MNSESQIPLIVLESICRGCSNNRCKEHQEKKILIDTVTGLAVEARCVCKHGE